MIGAGLLTAAVAVLQLAAARAADVPPSPAPAAPLTVSAAAHLPVEVVLTSGRVVRALEATTQAGRVRVVLPSGVMTFAADRVASIRRVTAGSAPGEPAPAPAAAAVPPVPAETTPAVGPAADATATEQARVLMALGRLDDAAHRLRLHLATAPDDAAALVDLGRVLVAQGRFEDALAPLRRAGEALPLPRGLRTARDLALAEALTRLDRLDEAASVLREAPEDARGEVARARLALRRDATASEGLSRHGSEHFVVHLDPGVGPLDVEPLLVALEETHAALAAALGDAPHDPIIVILHPGSEFWELTRAGADVAGLYDGKVRVPQAEVDPPGPRLSALLRHEVAHAFVDALAAGRADRWWHEGLAEHFEGAPVAATDRALARGLRAAPSAWPPPLTHENAHSRLEHVLRAHGMEGVRRLLAEARRRATIAEALEAAIGLTVEDLDAAWGRDLLARELGTRR